MDWADLLNNAIAAAVIIAGALRLLAVKLAGAIAKLADETKALRAAQVDNTHALRLNTEARETSRRPGPGRAAMLLLLAPLLLLASCATTHSPLYLRAVERNRQVWEEDRRPDLDPELVKSRRAEFEAQARHAKGSDQ